MKPPKERLKMKKNSLLIAFFAALVGFSARLYGETFPLYRKKGCTACFWDQKFDLQHRKRSIRSESWTLRMWKFPMCLISNTDQALFYLSTEFRFFLKKWYQRLDHLNCDHKTQRVLFKKAYWLDK